MEIDDAVGQIMSALKKNGIEDQTLIYFTSDHGSHIDKGTDGGSNYPFKGKITWLRHRKQCYSEVLNNHTVLNKHTGRKNVEIQ